MSGIAQLLQRLNERDIRLFLDRGELRFKAPKGAMNDVLLADLKACKSDLVKTLEQAEQQALARPQPLAAAKHAGAAPLSFAQQRLWFLYRLEGPSPTYNILLASRLTGGWQVDILERSLQFLVQRHRCLRTAFAEDADGTATQTVRDDQALTITRIDVSDQPDTIRSSRLQDAKNRLASTCFQLDADRPLIKIELFRYAADEWILLVAMHHIVGDGWSLGILSRELGEVYACYAAGQEPQLPAVTIDYRDYAWWQRQPEQAAWLQDGIERWCRLLENSEFHMDLRAGKPRPETRSYRGAVCSLELDASLSQQLESLAQRQGVSLFVLLLSAYFVLLQRYSGREDLLVGTQVANRHAAELESIVGFFVNTLVLRARPGGQMNFLEFLSQVNDYWMQALALQHVPFERLVETLKPERDLGYNPLVQIVFLWQNVAQEHATHGSLHMDREPLLSAAAKFDLSLELGMQRGRIGGVFEYATDVFETAVIERMTLQYQYLLQSIAECPEAVIAELRLAPQRPASLPSMRPTDVSADLATRFQAQVLTTPDAAAVSDGRQTLRYRELALCSDRLAARLQLAGVPRGSVIALHLPRTADYIVAMLATLKLGCAYLPLERSLPKARIEFMLKDAGVRAVVGETQVFADYPFVSAGSGDDGDGCARLQAPAAMASLRPAYLIYTSGSTGHPKGVWVGHHSVLQLAESLNDSVYRSGPSTQNVALMASFIFDASVQQIFAALLYGHCLYICGDQQRRDGAALLDFLQRYRITLSDCTPSLLQIMLDAGLAERDGLLLKQLVVGGEALPSQLIAKLRHGALGRSVEIFNVYGPTECTVDATLYRVARDMTPQAPIVSIGRPLPATVVKIVDRFGHTQPDGLAGEIYIAGLGLAFGYWRQPALTAERFVPGENGARWYRSGDLGRVNSDGELEFLGRLDDQVKVRGYRIELAEIESRLAALPSVQQAAVCLRGTGEPELVAYLSVMAPVSVSDLRAGLLQNLPDYMVPAQFVVVDRLPLNAAGKIDRKALQGLTGGQRLSDGLGGEPRGEREETLARVWCEVLGVDSVGRDDNFFAVGGDSIKALQIVSRLRQSGLLLEVRDLFTHATVKKLAPQLTAAKQNPPGEPESCQGDVALSPIQQHFFIRHGTDFHHFNQAFLLATDASDPERLRGALVSVCARHDAFRLRFTRQSAHWRQYYSEQPTFEMLTVDCLSTDELAVHAAQIQASFDLEKGGLLKVVNYTVAGRTYILMVAHHLIIDAVSWRILMEDLNAALLAGEAWQPPPATLSMQAWMQQCRLRCEQLSDEEKDYWRRQLDHSGGVRPAATYTDLLSVDVVLDAERSASLLTRSHRTYGTEMNDLLLAALLLAYRQWSGEGEPLRLMLEGHGRDALEGIDVSRTIGWFTTRYPLTLAVPQQHDLGYLIKSVKESLRAVPAKGIGYGWWRYLSDSAAETSAAEPTLSFNYLGQFGAAKQGSFAIADESIGEHMSPQATPPYLIELVGRHVAGVLSFEITYAGNVYAPQQMEAFAACFKQALIDVAEHTANAEDTSLTPSDIDFDGFDIQQLDDFLEEL